VVAKIPSFPVSIQVPDEEEGDEDWLRKENTSSIANDAAKA
jgi:hypothetical protein